MRRRISTPAFISSYRVALLGQAMIQEYLISEMADLLASGEFERKLEQIVEERLEVACEHGGGCRCLPLLRGGRASDSS